MSKQRREKERENLRQAILDAARELFVTQDYKAVSLRRIAEKIEYSPTAIYFYFKDKDEILRQLIREGFDLLMIRTRASDHPDPIEVLRQSCHGYLAFAREEPHYYKLMFQIESGAPHSLSGDEIAENEMIGKRVFVALIDIVTTVIAQQRSGDVANAKTMAAAIWASLHGLASLMLTREMLIEPYQETEEALITMILRGLIH